MKIYILRLALVLVFTFVCVNTQAYDINYAGCFKSDTVKYQSVDENNNPITLSELVTIPLEKDGTNRQVKFLLLTSMPYNANADRATTGEQPMDALLLRTIATEGAMTVQLDGQGFGISEGKTIPFLISRLDGRQAVDGLLAAIDYAQANGIAISDDYYTINAGYSLAGYRAVATQRYLEKYASQDVKDKFRLRKTVCGGAPINGTATGHYILDNYDRLHDYLSLFDGFVNTYRKSTLNAYSKANYYGIDNVIDKAVLDGKTPASKALLKALSKENMDLDWIPETPITDYHLADDDVVTYQNAQSALEHWGKQINLVDKQMTGKKWNVSLLRTIHDVMALSDSTSAHGRGAVDYYAGMIDGCLRDTVIADTYGKSMNFKDMLNVAVDLCSGLTNDVTINLPIKTLKSGTLTIKTIGYLHFTAEITDSLGNADTDLDVTINPEVMDSLQSHLTGVDARGYLRLPVSVEATLHKLWDLKITGSSDDVYQMLENLTAIVLHHSSTNGDDLKKYCDAFNNNFNGHIKLDLNLLFFKKTLDLPMGAWYFKVDDKYEIRPAAIDGSLHIDLVDFFQSLPFGWDKDLTPYMTIEGKSLTIKDYTAQFHVTEDNYGELKFYADIFDKDSKQLGRADFDVTGVDMNADGTQQTLNIGLSVTVNSIPLKITGRCSNLNDAVIAGILCYGNLACETEAQAQAYADAVNSQLQLELYVARVNDDGTYSDNPDYIDYGGVHAIVAQDVNGAYYAQYCLNWMGKTDVPLMTVIKELTK